MNIVVIGALVGLGFVLLLMVSLLRSSESSEKSRIESSPESESESESEAEADPEPEPEPESESESEAEADTEHEPESESESEAEADTEHEPESESESEAEADTEHEPETAGEPENEASPELATELVDEGEGEAEVESAKEADPMAEPKTPDPVALESVPRPPGTPAQAAPVEGASAWLLRGVSSERPEEASPGDSVDVALLLTSIDASDVDAVPGEAQPWTAGPVEVDYEVRIDGAASASGVEVSGRFSVDSEGDVRVELPLMVAFSLSGIELKVRFYAAGYEVGRARLFVPGRGNAGEGEGLSEGVLAIPDTILSTPED